MELIEDDPHLATLAELLAAQAIALNRVFARAFGDMLLGKTRSFRDVGRALKAQNQCRIALRLLLALRTAGQATKKSRNRTNGLLEKEKPHHDQDLGQIPSEGPSCPDQAPPQRRPKGLWTPERRAKQAELIRSSKPWLKSTGPRTEEGKARSAANALKHGFRSRPFIEQVRNERQLVRDATTIIALAKTILRTVEARSMRIPHITVWTGDPDLDGRPAHPNRPVNPL